MTAFDEAWNILKMRFKDYQGASADMQNDINFRYTGEEGNPAFPYYSRGMTSIGPLIADRLVHDKIQENIKQGKVGEQTTDALASKRPLFVPRFDPRAIHPKYTVADQSKLPHSMSDIYTDTPSINYYDPRNYGE